MSERVLIGVIGPGDAGDEIVRAAERLGELLAERSWVVISGGRPQGVMAAVNRGANRRGGLTVGLLPGERDRSANGVEIAIRTGLGSARNNVIALSARVLVAVGIGPGTVSEIALGIKAGTPVVVVELDDTSWQFLAKLGSDLIHRASSVEEAVEAVARLI